VVYFDCYEGSAGPISWIQRLVGSGIADSAKTRIDGEARFLRAFNYFKLVRYFGAYRCI